MSANPNIESKTILVIEDDQILSKLIKKKLDDLDYKVEFAKKIKHGQQILAKKGFDLLLLDYNLPDGTIENLITQAQIKLPPFIIMTANGNQQLAVQMMKLGAKDYLVKDQNFIELLPTVIKESFKDILLEKRLAEANQKLREKEEEYQFLFENSGVAIAIVDKYNEIKLINREMEKLTEYSKNQLERKNLFDLLVIGDSIPTEEEKQKLVKVESGKYEGAIRDKSGNIKDVLIKKNSFAEKEWAIVSLIDITTRKEKEKELNQAYNRLNKNINEAHKLHQNFLPNNHFNKQEVTGAVYYHPAQELGGDFYNYQKVNNKLIIYLADVSGHGLDGAMLNISIKEKINNLVSNYKSKVKYSKTNPLSLLYKNKLTPQQIMKSVFQSYLEEEFPDDYFLCLQIVLIDLQREKFLYSNSGSQIVPYIIKATGDLIKLTNADLPISSAISKDLIEFNEEEYSLEAGAKLFLSTDGLIEETNGDNYYGEARVEKLLEKYYYLPPEILKDKIRGNFLEFTTANNTKDDVTFMVVERNSEIHEQYQIKSDFNELVAIEKKIINFLSGCVKEANMIKMAIHEMIINAIEHGNQFSEDKIVTIDITVTDNYCRVVITDQGSGFDHHSRMSKKLYRQENQERGRGIVITAKIVDEIFYNQAGNQVCLINFHSQ